MLSSALSPSLLIRFSYTHVSTMPVSNPGRLGGGDIQLKPPLARRPCSAPARRPAAMQGLIRLRFLQPRAKRRRPAGSIWHRLRVSSGYRTRCCDEKHHDAMLQRGLPGPNRWDGRGARSLLAHCGRTHPKPSSSRYWPSELSTTNQEDNEARHIARDQASSTTPWLRSLKAAARDRSMDDILFKRQVACASARH